MSVQISPSSMAAARRVLEESIVSADPDVSADAAYADPDLFEFEREVIFKREWLYIGHVSQVPQPGYVFPRTVLDEPLLFVHDSAGEIRVMSALCQHRHRPLMGGPNDPELDRAVTRRNLVCPHHSWTYSLDGRLIAAPHINPSAPPSGRRTLVLPQCKVEIAYGLVFVNFDPTALPLRPALAKLAEVFEQHEQDGFTAARPVRRKNLPGNWKGHVEASLDAHHDGEVIAIVPTFSAVVSPTSVLIEVVNPVSASATDVESTILYPVGVTERPGFAELQAADIAALHERHAQVSASPRSAPSPGSARDEFSGWCSARYREGLAGQDATAEAAAPPA